MKPEDLEKLADAVAKCINQRSAILLDRLKHELSMRDQSAYSHARRISALERAIHNTEESNNDDAH